MSELLAIGVSHKTAPVEVRERLALPEHRAAEFTRDLLPGGRNHLAHRGGDLRRGWRELRRAFRASPRVPRDLA